MEASPLGSIIDNRAKPPAGLPGFVLRDREHGLESHPQLTNYPISRTPFFLFRAGEKYAKLS